MIRGMYNMKRHLKLSELHIGMKATADQLSQIPDKYMILLYDNIDDKVGTLVFLGNRRTKNYNKWFNQDKPITPIHHTCEELEENVDVDE